MKTVLYNGLIVTTTDGHLITGHSQCINLRHYSTTPYISRAISSDIKSDEQFNWRLAGLFDSDGYGDKYEASITLHVTEVNLAYILQERFGGVVIFIEDKAAVRWRVTRAQELEGVALCLNGKTFLKEDVMAIWADRFSFTILPTPNKISLDNPYISGLAEGDGTTTVKSTDLQPAFSVSNKNEYLLTLVLSAFGCGHVYPDRSWAGFKFYASSIHDLGIIGAYFAKYPLLSDKQLEFALFFSLIQLKKDGYHLKRDFAGLVASAEKRQHFYNRLAEYNRIKKY